MSEKKLLLRFLEHLHDEDVKRLVDPGFILRRLNPDIIQRVLATPCKLTIRDASDAHALYRKLLRENSLIEVAHDSPDRPGAVIRRELRKEILPLIRRRHTPEANEIHKGAINYYSQRHSDEDRAEELYHRLAMGQDSRTLDRYWRDGIGDRLAGSGDEFPPRSMVYLARKTGLKINIPATYWSRKTDVADWEWRVAGRARKLLQLDQPEKALELIEQREDRTNTSPLFVIEARALRRLGRLEQCRQVLDRSMKHAISASLQAAHAIELMMMQFWVELELRLTSERGPFWRP